MDVKSGFVLLFFVVGARGLACKAETSSRAGYLQSPGYPDYYHNNVHCQYNFETKAGYCGVQLKVTDFSLQSSGSCSADYLKLNAKPYCGEQLKDKTVSYRLPFMMDFTTDNTIPGRGFSMVYRYIQDCDSVCNKKFSGLTGYITPPTNPDTGTYKNNAFCNYQIMKKPGAQCVELIFAQLDMADVGDYIEIDGLKYTSAGFAGVTAVGTKVMMPFPQGGGPAQLDFISDTSGAKEVGFLLKYKQIMDVKKCPDRQCQPPLSKQVGILKSPGSPMYYPKNFNCEYTINQGPGSKFALISLQSPLANGDTLNLIEGGRPPQKLEYGIVLKVNFDTSSGKIRLKFHSDGDFETTFSIVVMQTAV